MKITKSYLKKHPDHIFVFGDNLDRSGLGGAAELRTEPNTYGFITKKHPNNDDTSFYKPGYYYVIFDQEINKLKTMIKDNPNKTFLISRLGAGLANKYHIWEKVIEPNIEDALEEFTNVKFLF